MLLPDVDKFQTVSVNRPQRLTSHFPSSSLHPLLIYEELISCGFGLSLIPTLELTNSEERERMDGRMDGRRKVVVLDVINKL